MANTLVRSIELLVSEPPVPGRLASPRPVGRAVPSEFDVDAGLLEALDILLDGSARRYRPDHPRARVGAGGTPARD